MDWLHTQQKTHCRATFCFETWRTINGRNGRHDMSDTPRRFPAPWSVEVLPGGFKVVDANGIGLAYCYARDDLAEKTIGAQHLKPDEARRIATNIAKLPHLLTGQKDGA